MDSRARAGPHGAPCWRLMVGAYARDARAYFAAPWASWTRALRSALPHPLDRPLRPQTGETAPAQSPCCCCQQGVEGASTTRWKARKARGWAGLVLLCTFGSAHSLAMALSSLAACFVHSPTQQQRPKPRGGRPSSGASRPAHGGGSVPGDPGATSVALVVWLNRRPSCFAVFYTPIYRLLARMNACLSWLGRRVLHEIGVGLGRQRAPLSAGLT